MVYGGLERKMQFLHKSFVCLCQFLMNVDPGVHKKTMILFSKIRLIFPPNVFHVFVENMSVEMIHRYYDTISAPNEKQ